MKCTLIDTQEEAPDVTSFRFSPEQPLMWSAGQYLEYTLPHADPDDRGISRWFTISSAPHEGHVMITTRQDAAKSSTFKAALFALAAGDTIEATGPEGDFVAAEPDQKMILIAGGMGVTPYRSMLTDLDHRGIPLNATLLYANRDSNFVFKDELDALAKKHEGFSTHYFTADERIDEASLRALVPELNGMLFYLSGPEPMVDILGKTLHGMQVSEEHIRRDDFPGYTWP